jgi:putative glutamine amidotransferase
MPKKPLIGITFDSQDPGHYSKYPWYALRENYCSSIAETGGVPFPLTHDLNLVDDYLSLINGLLITGGDFDLDPALYGESKRHETVKVKRTRTEFEMAMVHSALKKNIPVLGICGGHQLINVALGGTLIQHLPDEVLSEIKHEQPNPRHEAGHPVNIIKDTFLYKLIGEDTILVNSAHHQAIKKLAPDAVLNALAPDGVIEGFEVPEYKFCLGVQWHPEFFITPNDKLILESFVKASHG